MHWYCAGQTNDDFCIAICKTQVSLSVHVHVHVYVCVVLSLFKDLDNLWSALSAVLNIGNIEFRAVGNNDAAEVASPAVLTKGESFAQGQVNV